MNVIKVTPITGITGQNGFYLAELLFEKCYLVHGIKRQASSFNTDRIDHIFQDPHVDNARIKLHYGDLSDSTNCAIKAIILIENQSTNISLGQLHCLFNPFTSRVKMILNDLKILMKGINIYG